MRSTVGPQKPRATQLQQRFQENETMKRCGCEVKWSEQLLTLYVCVVILEHATGQSCAFTATTDCTTLPVDQCRCHSLRPVCLLTQCAKGDCATSTTQRVPINSPRGCSADGNSGGDGWTSLIGAQWGSTGDLCIWHGVTCNANGRVVGL